MAAAILFCGGVWGSGGAAQASAQSVTEGLRALRSGEYRNAARIFRSVLRTHPTDGGARRGLALALAAVGRYDQAEAVAREAAGSPAVARVLGRVLELRGRLDEAQAAYRAAITGDAPDRLTAEVDLAELLFRRGRTTEATARFDRFIDLYNNAGGHLTAGELTAVGRAVHALGRTNPGLLQDALRAFDEAAAADPDDPEPLVRTGNLFLETYAAPEAHEAFRRALALNSHHPGALLGEARALEFDGAPGATEKAEEVLETNPRHTGALTLLARLRLTVGDFGAARRHAERALETDPASLEALSALAAADFLSGDTAGFRDVRRRAFTINPRYSALDAIIAETAAQNRRYKEAARLAARAVARDSTDWSAWGMLGMNELRLGRIATGRRHMERAFEGDPFNPWFKNTLDLLDTFSRYVTHRTPHFELFLEHGEDELLGPYVKAVAEEAYDSLSRRYGISLATPVRVEMFPSHADFSVRTLGEAGLGALGVSFGDVLVMDSPAARERGTYNWASTLWHELSHTFHLEMTEHRVPRWFSEGLAVHEQTRARAGWGFQPSIPFLLALRDGRLKPVSRLNDGFMRPEYPEQVAFSYYEASLVFELLESRHGFGAIRSMLLGYRRGWSTDEVFRSALGTEPARFDHEFERYLRTKFRSALTGLADLGQAPDVRAGTAALSEFVRAHPGDLVGRLRLASALIEEGRYADARPHLARALRIFPEYGAPDGPYALLARVHREQGDLERAAAALARLNTLSESNYAALIQEADLLETLGRPKDAAAALRRTLQIDPYDQDVHERLAELLAGQHDRPGVVRERQAIVALKPVDRAGALYHLAVAQRDAGDTMAARRTVLDALDIAPNYEAALELLLELRGGRTPGGAR